MSVRKTHKITIEDQLVTATDLMEVFWERLRKGIEENANQKENDNPYDHYGKKRYLPKQFFENLRVDKFIHKRYDIIVDRTLHVRAGHISCMVEVDDGWGSYAPYNGPISGVDRYYEPRFQLNEWPSDYSISCSDIYRYVDSIMSDKENYLVTESYDEEDTDLIFGENDSELYEICRHCIPSGSFKNLRIIDLDYEEELTVVSLPLYIVYLAYQNDACSRSMLDTRVGEIFFCFSGNKERYFCNDGVLGCPWYTKELMKMWLINDKFQQYGKDIERMFSNFGKTIHDLKKLDLDLSIDRFMRKNKTKQDEEIMKLLLDTKKKCESKRNKILDKIKESTNAL